MPSASPAFNAYERHSVRTWHVAQTALARASWTGEGARGKKSSGSLDLQAPLRSQPISSNGMG
jgi:hypothetical protein